MTQKDDKKPARPRGPMERQQISGGRHDLLSNVRQREPGSSRGEADLTQGRRKDRPPDPPRTNN